MTLYGSSDKNYTLLSWYVSVENEETFIFAYKDFWIEKQNKRRNFCLCRQKMNYKGSKWAIILYTCGICLWAGYTSF